MVAVAVAGDAAAVIASGASGFFSNKIFRFSK
jgi:hypothetical protein